MPNKEIFLLYSNCKVVRGYSRSVICDLQRNKIFPVPNSLISLFENASQLYYKDIEKQLTTEEALIFSEYLQFLAGNELGFFSSKLEAENFPVLSDEWDYPAVITNCIIDANEEIIFFHELFIRQLDTLGCQNLQIRFFKSPQITHLEYLIEQVNRSEIKSLEFILADMLEEGYCNSVSSLIKLQGKVSTVLLHSSLENKILQRSRHYSALIVKSSEKVLSEKCCGIINQGYFHANVSTFTESLAHNTCLNRKISIDMDGNIKNCPSMIESFGNIKDTTLEEAINKPGFKKYWNITKDEITKCKDCEFRRVCTDCRAYLENPNDIYSAPLKCGYDPYTCEWEEWSTHPLKQDAITQYGMQEFINK